MINYKNIQERYEADYTTISYSWGKTCLSQEHQGSLGVKPKVNSQEPQLHGTVFLLLPCSQEKMQIVSPTTLFSLSRSDWGSVWTCNTTPMPVNLNATASWEELGPQPSAMSSGEHLPCLLPCPHPQLFLQPLNHRMCKLWAFYNTASK